MKNTIIRAMILCAIGAGSLSSSAQQTTTEKEVEREIKKAEKEIQNAAKEIQKANKEVKVSNIQIERSVKESMAKALKPIVVEGFPMRGTGTVTVTGFPMNINQNFDYVFKDLKDVKAKEVSQEISTSKSPDIYIDNTSRNIQVKIWDQSKVKVVTTVYYEGEGKLSDEEWFEKMNLSLKSIGTTVRVKSGTISGGSYTINGSTFGWSGSTGVAVFNDKGESIGSKSNTKRIVTIYVPAASKLDIDSKYGDLQLTGNYGNATVDISNGSLEAESFSKLYLRSKYSNVTMENAAIAEIEFMNGRFSAKEIGEADLDTKYSTIEIASAKKAVFRSTNDEYEIEDANELRGRKNYGNFRITKLNNSLEMDGTNADVKIRNVGANLDVIKIDNKYADIRIPLRNIKNYSVKFIGAYSTVYGNFEKEPLVVEEKKPLVKEKETDALAKQLVEINRSITRYSQSRDNESNFSAKVGEGKGLKIDMSCQNCTVDFK
ncbi:MAG TPA: hypothetical protein VJA82_11935 [Sediminibacterium sp.]|uniref:hypothetical protein n=1 Tax=Sediminibacterium sp. TaxID=1917865 RepID=UPI0008B9A7BB|nr:hypothetical protein [Sediminibacterium sp.]OHC86556.1 MAG: hypothetical protein A2472_03045 [Sphingobacteriia bacterium RIFOXYC2_FULL_35_18]OHC88628.1 MAG: hypothetical protein A2546_00985 [Sphingobacteriia bacterium RIFOXYD2_FULL_35_12]HLD54007.1 hypothetical protein [Sediminibacterium sp.]